MYKKHNIKNAFRSGALTGLAALTLSNSLPQAYAASPTTVDSVKVYRRVHSTAELPNGEVPGLTHYGNPVTADSSVYFFSVPDTLTLTGPSTENYLNAQKKRHARSQQTGSPVQSDYSMTIEHSNPNNSALLTLTTIHPTAYDGKDNCDILEFCEYKFKLGKDGKVTTLSASSPSELEAKLEALGLTNAHAYFGPMPAQKLGDQAGRFLSDNKEGQKFTGGSQQWKRNHATAAQSLENSATAYLVVARTDQTGASVGFYVDNDLVARCSKTSQTTETPLQGPTNGPQKIEVKVGQDVPLDRIKEDCNRNYKCEKKNGSVWKYVALAVAGGVAVYAIHELADEEDDNGNKVPNGWHEEDPDHDGVGGDRP